MTRLNSWADDPHEQSRLLAVHAESPDRLKMPEEPPIVTILIVENEENNRRLVEQILDFAGYQYISATNGLEALDVLDQTHVDLILIDLSMPIMDGYQATEIIRGRPECATLPIIAVTAHAMSDDRELALSVGCTDYLAKPFRPNELLRVIARILDTP